MKIKFTTKLNRTREEEITRIIDEGEFYRVSFKYGSKTLVWKDEIKSIEITF